MLNLMNKTVFTVLLISLFGLTGCGDDQDPMIKKTTIEKGKVNAEAKKDALGQNAIGQAEEAVKKLNKKTEDQLALEDFERLIAEPPKLKVNNEKITIQEASPADIEIFEVTSEELRSIK